MVGGRQGRTEAKPIVNGQEQTAATVIVRSVSERLDVLDGFDELKICVGYKLNGKDYDYLPPLPSDQASVEAVYETIEG